MEKNGSFIVTFMTGRGKHSIDGIPKLLNHLKKTKLLDRPINILILVDQVLTQDN